jgi:hypothetical protein
VKIKLQLLHLLVLILNLGLHGFNLRHEEVALFGE